MAIRGGSVAELVFGCDKEVAAWVADRIPHVKDFGPSTAIAVADGDRVLAGVVYHEYQPAYETIQLSMAAASPMWARQGIIAGLLAYPFDQLKVHKVWTATPHTNEAALKVNAHIGFTREGVLGHHFGRKKHAVVMRMLEPAYRKRYGVN